MSVLAANLIRSDPMKFFFENSPIKVLLIDFFTIVITFSVQLREAQFDRSPSYVRIGLHLNPK